MKREVKLYLKEQKKVFSLFDMKYIDDSDKRNISFVSENIFDIDTEVYVSSEYYALETVKTVSVESLRLFDAGIGDRVYSSLLFSKVEQIFNDESLFMCNVAYSMDPCFKKIVPDSGIVKSYKIPYKLNDNSFIYMGHEYMHSLKDTNYEEYKLSQSLGDVVPLFYEMVCADMFPKLAKGFWQSRLDMLKGNAVVYKNVSVDIQRNVFNRSLNLVNQSICGQYLNSFYYALLLFNMYKRCPQFVTGEIIRVLNHEITTMDLLVGLGVYNVNKDNLVIEEINKLRKVIK